MLTAGTASADPPPERILRIEFSTPLDWIDPALAFFTLSWQAQQATCARLVNYPDAEGAVGRVLYPEVAAALPTVSADGLTYTFTLRDGFSFSPPAAGQSFEARDRVTRRRRRPATSVDVYEVFVDESSDDAGTARAAQLELSPDDVAGVVDFGQAAVEPALRETAYRRVG